MKRALEELTLRDLLAIAVMLMDQWRGTEAKHRADLAYKLADAMLERRQQ